MKVYFFVELKDHFFLSFNLKEITQTVNMKPHSLIYSLIILGGLPLAFSVMVFLVKGIYKNLRLIQERYPNYYFCGLISIITETFLWDSNNSIFFWIIILYAVTLSKNSFSSDNSPTISASDGTLTT